MFSKTFCSAKKNQGLFGKGLIETVMHISSCWEKEKLMAISIFSFSHNIFYAMKDKLNVLSYIELFTKRQNFKTVQL